MPNDVTIAELKISRSSIKGSQTKIKNFVEANKDKMMEFEVTTRLDLLENFFKQFQNVQCLIERMDSAELNKDDREVFEETYCNIKALLLSLQASKRRPSVPFVEAASGQSILNLSHINSQSRRLPKLELPHFSGKYTDWHDFDKTFTTLVDNDEYLTPIEKFTHLRNCLDEPALNTIKALEITDENYKEALKLLRARYENKRIIFQAHIRAINDIKPISKSSASLRALIDSVNCNLRALKSLGTHEELSNAFLLFMVSSKLDVATISKWEECTDTDKLPTWSDLEACLVKRCLALENKEYGLEAAPSTSKSSASGQRISSRQTTLTTSISSDTQKGCVICGSVDHNIYRCQKFSLMSVPERFTEAKKLVLCINCLHKGHRVRFCRASSCAKCRQRHHTLLHGEIPSSSHSSSQQQISTQPPIEDQRKSEEKTSTALCSTGDNFSFVNFNPNSVILATAIVNVLDRFGEVVSCRALLDSASQLNFINKSLAQILCLKQIKSDVVINGLNDIRTRVKHKVSVAFESRSGGFNAELEMLVVPQITSDQPCSNIDITSWKIPSDITLADPDFHRPQGVDILLGAEVFFDLMGSKHLRIAENLPTFHETKLGWVVSGKIVHNNANLVLVNAAEQSTDDDKTPMDDNYLCQILEKFWTVEGFESKEKELRMEEIECEQHFVSTTKRDKDGRFLVNLPLKENISALGESFYRAKKRFLNLERKLHKNPDLLQHYSDFLSEYLSLNHMQLVNECDRHKCAYFLPHHCVLKPASTSTKLRVVFDASCKTSSGVSLNSLMKVGPTIQKDLFSVILRFRSHRFALTADITKMYRQVQLEDSQTYLQCILWRSTPSDQLQIFRLKTITYGTASASFLVIRCLHQLAQENKSTHPIGSKSLLNDFYVDDMLSGANSLEEATRLREEVSGILKSGGFDLRKWSSNDPRLLDGVPEEDREKSVSIDSDDLVKTLGLSWHPKEDVFRFEYLPKPTSGEATKRKVLSDIATLFDPLGLLNPIIVSAKIFMQHLWRLKIDWDAALPEPYQTQWNNFRSKLPSVNQLKFSRFVLTPTAKVVEIHGFSDASTVAYGCCIYVRCVLTDGQVVSNLLCAKSRIAPIKTISLPRLELCAAELLANLMDRVVSELEFNIDRIYCWTDSEIVLHWLAAHPSSWATFVSNRVSTIQRLTQTCKWMHVDTKQNPADLVSRGSTPEKLIGDSMWTQGPPFFAFDKSKWPEQHIKLDLENAPERKKMSVVLHASKTRNFDPVSSNKFANSFERLRRVFAYITRFVDIHIFKRKQDVRCSTFTPSELSRALKFIVRVIQRDSFSEEFKELKKGRPLPNSCRIKKLCPFIDDEGLIRVGGRLQNAGLSFDATHPMLLPNYNPFVFSLFEHFHFRNLHAGPQSLLAAVRQQFWVIGGRDIARKVVHRCLICFRHRPKLYHQIMGDLPSHRVQPARPFLKSGVDFCGPVMVHYKRRGTTPTKAYIAVYVCFATKAIHLELVGDLTTESFIMSLLRFVSRRGDCKTLYCDNATNFVGARRQMKEFRDQFFAQEVRDHIVQACAKDGVNFVHIPPRSPHFGGLWEAGVKSAKYHLSRVVQGATLTYEEMLTVITQIEAILNSRPLFPMSSDPSDMTALTPAHFLVGEPLNAPVDPDLSELKMNRLSRFQHLQRIRQSFWSRWTKEYLVNLQSRSKWTSPSTIKLGALVLVAEDNVPPQKWILGRIEEVHPGKDGVIRVATVKTSHGLFKRAVHKLAPLPIDEEDAD